MKFYKKLKMKNVFIFFLKIYQVFFSCIFISSCRFYPTCSNYSILAIKKYGCLKGMIYIMLRIIKCNPFCKGGIDQLK